MKYQFFPYAKQAKFFKIKDLLYLNKKNHLNLQKKHQIKTPFT